MKVGLVGCGTLGSAIAERLLDQGCELIVWNRSPLRNERIAQQATPATSPRDVAERAFATLTLVSGEDANTAVYEGDTGLFAAAGEGILINLSTLSPRYFRALAVRAAESQTAFVEAPVLGTAAPARSGQLVALVAGGDAAIDRAEPVLRQFCRSLRRAGAEGTGAAMKIVHNTILTLYWRAVGEAFDFGRACGLSLDTMVDVIGDSFAANQQWPLKAAVLRGESTEAGFTLFNLEKELALQLGLYEQAGAPSPMLDLALERTRAAVVHGWGERDVASLAILGSQVAGSPD